MFNGINYVDSDSVTVKEVSTLNRNLRPLPLIRKVSEGKTIHLEAPGCKTETCLKRLSFGKIIPSQDIPAHNNAVR